MAGSSSGRFPGGALFPEKIGKSFSAFVVGGVAKDLSSGVICAKRNEPLRRQPGR